VHAHVAERAAALLNKAQAPVEDAAAPDRSRAGVIQLAELALLGQFAQVACILCKTGRERHHVDHTRRFSRFHQLACRFF
jgi:hypothetical protein